MESPDLICARIARVQFGLINQAQALAAGLTYSGIARRVRSGRWERVLPGVFRIGGAPGSWLQDAMAACLWAGEGSALSFGAAARKRGWHGFEGSPVEISTTGKKRIAQFKVHHCDEFLLGEIAHIGEMPLTSARRTLMDLAGSGHPRAERALDQALREAHTTLAGMWLIYDEDWMRGRRGIARVRLWLRERTPGLAPTDSVAEDALWALIVKSHMPTGS